jgi:hypothetical protein
MLYRAFHIAQETCDGSTGNSHPAQDRSALRAGCTVMGSSFGILKAKLCSRELVGIHQGHREDCAKQRARLHHRLGHSIHPAEQRMPTLKRGRVVDLLVLDQMRRPHIIMSSERVADGLGKQSALLVPHASSSVQSGKQIGVVTLYPVAQHLGEEVMVAIPAALVVKRDHKEVGTLKVLQHSLTG